MLLEIIQRPDLPFVLFAHLELTQIQQLLQTVHHVLPDISRQPQDSQVAQFVQLENIQLKDFHRAQAVDWGISRCYPLLQAVLRVLLDLLLTQSGCPVVLLAIREQFPFKHRHRAPNVGSASCKVSRLNPHVHNANLASSTIPIARLVFLATLDFSPTKIIPTANRANQDSPAGLRNCVYNACLDKLHQVQTCQCVSIVSLGLTRRKIRQRACLLHLVSLSLKLDLSMLVLVFRARLHLSKI